MIKKTVKNTLMTNLTTEYKRLKTERRLANWIEHQKINYKKGILFIDKIRKLEALPNWKWN